MATEKLKFKIELYATMWARQQALSDAELRLQALHNEDGVMVS